MNEHRGRQTKDGIRIYDPSDFAGMHAAGKLAAQILDDIAEHVFVGQTTGAIDGVITQMVAGKLSRKSERLINITHDALMRGIEVVKPGNTFGDIGHAIQTFAESHRMSVVTDFCGHGLGRVFHAPPNVLHYGRPGTGAVLEPGMFFTIEPMVNLGRAETKVLADDWTAVTRDKSLSAQFEHSIGVTETGCEIFTQSPGGMFHPTYSQG
mgnify:CR=1 FL=1